MRNRIIFVLMLLMTVSIVRAQRKLPPKSKEERTAEKQAKTRGRDKQQRDTELRWDPRRLPGKSKGFPEISAWHAGTSGIIAPDAAEISLFESSRIGFSRKTELLFRLAEEPLLPNLGLKHLWWTNKRLFLASGHSLYYPYPGLKILQHTGFRDLVADSVKIGQGIVMRHEILFSWLMNPQIKGCPHPAAGKILTLQLGTEFYVGFRETEVQPFDYIHLIYHSQLLDGKVLYYGGLQFDSYLGNRCHYSLNGQYYSVDFRKDYALEANLRFTYYVSRRFGISVAGKGAYLNVAGEAKFIGFPLLDLTYLVNPGRSTIKHGLSKRKIRR